MPPVPLLGLYKQYKTDTDAVASWLASTAKSVGFSPKQLSSSHSSGPAATGTHPASGRLKGKQRKQAKEAAKNPSESAAPRYTVAIKDFVPLARFIAEHQRPLFKVPHELSATLRRVISCRSAFGGLLGKYGMTTDSETNKKHDHFLQTLRSVQETLQPLMQDDSPTEPPPKPEKITRADDRFINRFGQLSVHEPSEQFLDYWRADTPQRPTAQPDDSTRYQAEDMHDVREAVVAWELLVTDLQDIRQQIMLIWQDHRNDTIDLGAAAVATNIAVSMARQMIAQVQPLLDKLPHDTSGLIDRLYAGHCARRRAMTSAESLAEIEDGSIDDFYDEAYWTYVISQRIVDKFKETLPAADSTHAPCAIDEEASELYDFSKDPSLQTAREKRHEYESMGFEMLMELYFFSFRRDNEKCPFQDELLHDVREFERTRHPTLPLVFSLQAFLDVHSVMRGFAEASYREMWQSVNEMKDGLHGYLDAHKEARPCQSSARLDAYIREILELINYGESDPVHESKMAALAETDNRGTITGKSKHRTMKLSPVISGLWLRHLQYHVYQAGLHVINCWMSVQSAAHLHNGLRQRGLVRGEWATMEEAVAVVGPDSIWLGGKRPTSPSECFARFGIQIGIPLSVLKIPQEKRHNKNWKQGPSRLIRLDGLPVSGMISDEFGPDKAITWTAEKIHDMVKLSRRRKTAISADGLAHTYSGSLAQLQWQMRRGPEGQGGGKASGGPGKSVPPPDKVIRALAQALKMETAELVFPFLALHVDCYRVLHDIGKACDPSMLKAERGIVWVAGEVLNRCRQHGAAMPKKAAAVMNSMLDTNGGGEPAAAADANADADASPGREVDEGNTTACI
jgi:hypothetical protein